MIPERWDNMGDTPFLEVTMKNGKKLYIHKAFKRVFTDNPLMKQEQVAQLSDKMSKEKKLIDRIKNSKLKRRQIKETQKNQPEVEVK